MIDVRHQQCGKVAFRLRCTIDEARNGVIMNNAMLAYDDGRKMVDGDGADTTGDLIRCQACGLPAGTVSIIGDEAIAVTLFVE